MPEPARLTGTRADMPVSAELRRNVAFWMLREMECRLGEARSDLVIDFAARRTTIDEAAGAAVARVAARLAGEWMLLARAGVPLPLAGLAAARVAAQFAEAEHLTLPEGMGWAATMAADMPPSAASLADVSRRLADYVAGAGAAVADEAAIARLRAL